MKFEQRARTIQSFAPLAAIASAPFTILPLGSAESVLLRPPFAVSVTLSAQASGYGARPVDTERTSRVCISMQRRCRLYQRVKSHCWIWTTFLAGRHLCMVCIPPQLLLLHHLFGYSRQNRLSFTLLLQACPSLGCIRGLSRRSLAWKR